MGLYLSKNVINFFLSKKEKKTINKFLPYNTILDYIYFLTA